MNSEFATGLTILVAKSVATGGRILRPGCRPSPLVALMVAALLLAPSLLRASTTESIQDITIQNADSFLNNGVPSRQTIDVLSHVVVNSSTANGSDSYTLHYKLYNAADASHTGLPLNVGGQSQNFQETPITLNNLPLGASTHNQSDSLKPYFRLDPYQQYNVELSLYRSGSPISGVVPQSDPNPRTFYHFTSQNSDPTVFNVIGVLDSASFSHVSAVQSVQDKQGFTVHVTGRLYRYDLDNSPSTAVPVTFTCSLVNDLSQTVALTSSTTALSDSVPAYTPPSQPVLFDHTLSLSPQGGPSALDLQRTYHVVVTLSYTDDTGQSPVTGNSLSTISPTPLFLFNGRLLFGPVATRFTSLSVYPDQSATPTVSASPFLHAVAKLQVDQNSGYVISNPSATYGSGNALDVWLLPNGDATNAPLQSVAMTTPSPDITGNIRFERVNSTLDNSGAHGQIRITLPAGLGYTTDPAGKLQQQKVLFPTTLSLPANLVPTSLLHYSPGPSLWFSDDSKPVLIEANAVDYDPVAAEIRFAPLSVRYIRKTEFDQLDADAPTLLNPSGALKRSNDKYFREVSSINSANIIVHTDNSHRALVSYNLNFNSTADFRAHFPYDVRLTWSGGAAMHLTDGLVTTDGSSIINAVSASALSYTPNCPGCVAANSPFVLNFTPQSANLYFTVDGGLIAQGQLPTDHDVRWGYINPGQFAQHIGGINNANLHVAGVFLRGGQATASAQDDAGVLLLTGVRANDLTWIERPGQLSYLAGLADYPGLNFSMANNALVPDSIIAGVPVSGYQLQSRSKYYVRPGGVAGVHEAQSGTFPSNLTIYNYLFTFSRYALSYAANQNIESATDGSVYVPAPSDFTQQFVGLKFNCLGGLESASVPDNDLPKILSHWQADFQTLAIDFKRNAADACDPTKGYLTLGVEAHSTPAWEPLFGQLGFESSGNLINQAFGLEGVDSRLNLPNQTHVNGRSNDVYLLTPVCGAYLNDYREYTPGTGWMNVIGKLDVPFFEDIKAHIFTAARTTNFDHPQNQPLSDMFVMGGWPRQQGDDNHGWQINNENYFTGSYFDPTNRGFPYETTTPGLYRHEYADDEDDTYHPRAQRTWIKVVKFDYPLDWSTLTRSFASTHAITNNLVFIEATHQVNYLAPKDIEVKAGAQLEDTPYLNLASLAFNKVADATGLSDAFDKAVGKPVRQALLNGEDAVNGFLSDSMFDLLDKKWVTSLLGSDPFGTDALTHGMYTDLHTAYLAQPNETWLPTCKQIIQGYVEGTGPKAKSDSLDSKLNKWENLQSSIHKDLTNFNASISNFQYLVQEDATGKNPTNIISVIRQDLILIDKLQNIAHPTDSGRRDQKIQEVIEDYNDAIAWLSRRAAALSNKVYKIDISLTDSASMGGQIMRALTNDTAKANMADVCSRITDRTYELFNKNDYSIDNPFNRYSEQQFRDNVRRRIVDELLASVEVNAVKQICREWIYDLNAEFHKLLDNMFQHCNSAVRKIVAETLSESDDKVKEFNGDLKDTGGVTRLDGVAHFRGDSLTLLRLDAKVNLEKPKKMNFEGYFQIKELNSSGTPGCGFSSGTATEVTVGAKKVKLDSLFAKLEGDIEGKFTFETDPFKVVGVGASFATTSPLNFKQVKVTKLAAAVAFGKNENYFSGFASVAYSKTKTIGSKTSTNDYTGAGGLFLGEACSTDPIKLWDPDAASVIGPGKFAGLYIFGEMTFPLNAVLGIPTPTPACTFNLKADVGVGFGYFDHGLLIGKMKLAVDGPVLCLATVHGDILLLGKEQNGDWVLKGSGSVSAKLGSCPICATFSKSYSFTLKK